MTRLIDADEFINIAEGWLKHSDLRLPDVRELIYDMPSPWKSFDTIPDELMQSELLFRDKMNHHDQSIHSPCFLTKTETKNLEWMRKP